MKKEKLTNEELKKMLKIFDNMLNYIEKKLVEPNNDSKNINQEYNKIKKHHSFLRKGIIEQIRNKSKRKKLNESPNKEVYELIKEIKDELSL